MLLYGTVCVSLVWMHFSFRKDSVGPSAITSNKIPATAELSIHP
jgi:hypothetical protein